jgi:hypothetical protein
MAVYGIVSKSAFAAEQLKISVTPCLKKKCRIFEILDGLENRNNRKFDQFALVR